MKKTTIFVMAVLFTFAFAACDNNASSFREMKNICEDIEKNFEKYTEQDF